MHIIINKAKYDLSGFADRHPGGKRILEAYDGLDATDVFTEFHKPSTRKLLDILPSEKVVTDTDDNDIERDFRELRRILEAEGRFIPSRAFYTRKLIELFGMLALTITLLRSGSTVLAPLVAGLFFQQAGWLAHDFGHSQVTAKHTVRQQFLYLIGSVFQGFTASWWIPKHMMHHARPNAIDEVTGKPVDTDIDTAPFIYWTERLLPPTRNVLQTVQGYLLWALLPFSKFVWDFESLRVSWERRKWTEVALVAAHHITIIALAGPRFYVISRLWGGFLIGWVFIMSHNGMEYYERPTLRFYESQIRTTRNVSLTPFWTWFTGGLNYQIEHHLFPRMPRHHFPAIADRVRALCAKHGLAYVVTDMVRCSSWLTRYLNGIGRRCGQKDKKN